MRGYDLKLFTGQNRNSQTETMTYGQYIIKKIIIIKFGNLYTKTKKR